MNSEKVLPKKRKTNKVTLENVSSKKMLLKKVLHKKKMSLKNSEKVLPKKRKTNKVTPKNVSSKKMLLKKVLRKKKMSLKKVPLTARILRKKGICMKQKKRKVIGTRGVVYFSHVPHGFYEEEMRQFLSQFGKITNINIPRSSRTGKYRGYAFVEFLYPEVAKIVAETMNNYLMFQKILKAKYIPPEEQKPYCFRYRKSKVPLLVKRRRYLRDKSSSKLDDIQCEKEAKRLEKSVNKKRAILQKLGINYEFHVQPAVH